ncbi:exosomal polycystin-1-interacting protein isoform X2 [Hoplias malabaricus]|uniref:exosomal polycystin-1-interacting protein isoform X2 n=1 Tax=Hoplias malabaricus TaxID=27720 RepID=UPI00346265A2
MTVLGHTGCVVLYCVLGLVMPRLLRGEFTLAFVREDSLLICLCSQDLVACSVINSSECYCDDRPLFTLEQAHGPGTVYYKRLTVWYTSSLNVARLLNNSEIRHLALFKCDSTVDELLPFDHFSVRRLERLSVSFPLRRSGQSQDVVLGRDMGAPYHEEARIAIIHRAVLAGNTGFKAYTVRTEVDSKGMVSFPNIFMSHEGLPEMTSMFVTFVY